MTPEEQAVVDTMKKEMEEAKVKAEAVQRELEELKKKNNSAPTNTTEPAKKTLEEQEEENRRQQEKIEAQNKKIESAVEFNYKIEAFAKENKEIVGDEIVNIIELAKGRNYTNSMEKADEIRGSILNKYFSVQKNIDALMTEGLKKKAQEFLALTQIKRSELSGEYWELFELSIANLKREKKHEQLLKGNKGENVDDFQKEYKAKLTEKSKDYYFPDRKKTA